jgi:protein-L-isoaspartate O-methyltransferase
MGRFFGWATLIAIALSPAIAAQESSPEKVAPYYPSPLPVVTQMLELGELKAGQLHYDLGSGDGRLVIAAAQIYGARSVGYEIDAKLVESSRRQIEKLELSHLASIRSQDLFAADFSKPDLISVYLLPRALARLQPLLEEQMKPGSIVVSHDFQIPGWEPDQSVEINEEVEVEGLPHSVHIYRR